MAVLTTQHGFKGLQSGHGPRAKRNEELGFSQPYYNAESMAVMQPRNAFNNWDNLAITPKSSMGDYITSKSSLEGFKGGFIP